MTKAQPALKTENGQLVCSVPLALKKRGGRKTVFFAPDGKTLSDHHESACQEALVLAIARAFRWKRLLDEGKFATICELAHATKQDPSYVMRILRLTLLAPDIIEAILAGREPSGLSLERLTKTLPRLWEEQRVVLGFPPVATR